MLESEAYKTYHVYVTGEKTLKPKKKKADSESSPKEKPAQASKGKRIKTPSKVAQSTKKKQPATKSKVKGLIVLSEVALTEAEQMKLATKRSLIQTHSSHASGSGDEVDTLSKVLDEKLQKKTGNDANEESDAHDDSDENESDDEVYTPPDYQLTEESEEQEGDDKVEEGEEEHEDEEMIYEDLNLNRERNNADISSVSDLVSKFINPSTDEGIDSALNQNIQSNALIDIPVTATTETPLTMTTNFQLPFPNIHLLQQTPNLSTSTTFPTTNSLEIPNFASLFGFEQRISSLKIELSELKQTNQFVKVVSSIPGIVDNYLALKTKEAVDVAVKLKSNKLREEAQAENQDFINSLNSNMNKIIKEHVKAQTSKIMSKVKKYVTETLRAKVLVRSTNQPQTSYVVASSLSELELKKILMDKMEEDKSIDISEVEKNLYNALVEAYKTDKDIISTYGDVVIISRGHGDEDKDEEPSAGSNQGTKRRRSGKETELTNEPTHKESRTTISSRGASRSQPTDLDDYTHQEFNTRDEDITPTREAQDERQFSNIVEELEYHLKKSSKLTNDQLDLGILLKEPYPHDLEQSPTLDSELQDVEDKLYKFREGDFKRLRCRDIEDMLLLLVQVKLTNLSLDERYALNVALRMYTRRIVIQERVEDLKLADDMNRNRLMRTGELHKFSDDTLNHVRTSLNDIATRIQMEYLPKRRWTNQDKRRARVMINAIDRKLKDRRLMRSLEKFVGGRPYGEDLRTTQRTKSSTYGVLII
ncbi:hypothetical protein Tco_0643033 [Tanacetum coccineum]